MKIFRTILFAAVVLGLTNTAAWGTTTYYSQTSGDPGTVGNWNKIRGGGGSSPANFTAGDIFVIQNGHTMTTAATWSISGTGSKLWIENGGILIATSAITVAAATTFQIDGGGTYKHQNNTAFGSSIFQGTKSFAATSTVELNNSSTTGPSSVVFGNLIVNFTSTPSGSVNCSGGIGTINGNLTIQNTSTVEFRLSASTALTLNLAGDLIVQGGILDFASSAGSSVARTLNLGGSYNQTGGTVKCTGTSNAVSINFTGSGKTFTQSAGTLTNTNINWAINSGASLTLNNNLPIATSRSLTVNGTLDCGTNTISGAGAFTLAAGGTLANSNTSGIDGSITVSGTKTFTDGANYTFNAATTAPFSSLQSTSVTANNLTVNGGITLNSSTVAVGGTLTLTSGRLTLGANNLTVGSVSGGSSSAYVDASGGGEYRQTVSATGGFAVPVGDATNYSPATISVTAGSFSSAYVGVKVTAAKHPSNTSVTNYINRYWTVSTSGITSQSYDASFTYVPGDVAGTEASLYGGAYSGPAWILLSAVNTGTHSFSGSGFTSAPIYFTAGESSALPVEMASFTASMQSTNSAILKWSTATEVNNNGFEIERRAANSELLTANSKQSIVNSWQKIGFVVGAGTSNSPKEYSFTDQGLAPGVQIYRIKQIDNDGAFKYSASAQVDAGVAAKSFQLLGNYPNPFNPTTEIRFSVPENGFASLKVYNILGQEVTTLFNGIAQSGHYIAATFNTGSFASGVYFSRLEYGGKSLVQRMLLTK